MQPTLSLCIPTYNRAGYLYHALRSIVSQNCFLKTEDVEIVICDNCSSDDTEKIARKFVDKFPEKIKYFRNETNILDKNFEKALSHGTGKLLKLHNDTVILKDDVLFLMVEVAKRNLETKPIIFFVNRDAEGKSDVLCNDLNEFISDVSFGCTWIGAFSIWKSDFADLRDFSRKSHLRLTQVDVLFRLIAGGKKVYVFSKLYGSVQALRYKGGYNIAQVFGENYLSLYQEYLRNGFIRKEVYEQEKRKLLVKHIIPYYFDYKKNFQFERTGYAKYLKDFRSNWYFYFCFVWIALRQLKVVREWIKRIFKKNESALWRNQNSHNRTTIESEINQEVVFVGKGTYGNLNVQFFGHPKELLIIGNYVSIANDVKFILGGNHSYGSISTFPFKVFLLNEKHRAQTKGAIIVDDDVWIGDRCTILSGVTLGQGAVIGAGSVVVRDVPPYSVVAGNPAKVVKYRFEESIIRELINFDFSILRNENLIENKNVLFENLTRDNVRSIIEKLNKTIL